jgi:phosphate/sulfate permease
VLITIVGSLMTLNALIGYFGAFRHKKVVLIVYLLLIWPILGVDVAVGFMSYHQRNDGNLMDELSVIWNTVDRQNIQDDYECCGFLWALDRPFIDSRCIGGINGTTTTNSTTNTATEITNTSEADDSTLQRRSLRHFKRQDIPTIDTEPYPGCVSTWGEDISNYLKACYIFAFSLIILLLSTFIIGILTTNHIYD